MYYPIGMGHSEDAAELKAIAGDFGLRIHELRINHPTDVRYLIHLEDGDASDKVYVHASATRFTLSHDKNDGESTPLT